MRQVQNGRRPRGRHHSGGNGNGGNNGNTGSVVPSNNGGNGNGGGNRPRSASALRHQTFDSNCIELRVRGNAWQVHEKYQALARDAQSSGDRVAAENYLQHAEHYYRIIEAINEATAAEQRTRPQFDPQQQPTIPPNYYGGTPQPNMTQGDVQPSQGDAQGQQPSQYSAQPQPSMPPAEVEMRQKNSFFTPEEIAEDSGNTSEPPPLVAQR